MRYIINNNNRALNPSALRSYQVEYDEEMTGEEMEHHQHQVSFAGDRMTGSPVTAYHVAGKPSISFSGYLPVNW